MSFARRGSQNLSVFWRMADELLDRSLSLMSDMPTSLDRAATSE
jgi:hypothetical protein